MKSLAISTALSLILVACGSNEHNTDQNLDVHKILNDITILEKSDAQNPIVDFQQVAKNQADKSLKFNKNNIGKVLFDARDFSHCIITVDDHTILSITDFEDCQQSGSWGVCMPMANGYIKKGELIRKSDYLNNLIGTPDMQVRRHNSPLSS
jgi:hypothetical protein